MIRLLLALILLIAACGPPATLMIRNGNAVHWEPHNLPIPMHHGPLSQDVVDSYSRAVDWIHAQVGCEIFTKPTHSWQKRTGAINLTCYNKIEKPGGNCGLNFHVGGQIKHINLLIPCHTSFPETQDKIAKHELLHAIGLDHDSELGTIMYPNVVFSREKIQQVDLQVLRRLYCGR